MRALYAEASDLLLPYNRIPLLFGRLNEPGIKEECIIQFRSVPVEAHELSTLEIITRAGRFFNDFVRVKRDGSNISPALMEEATRLNFCFDEIFNYELYKYFMYDSNTAS